MIQTKEYALTKQDYFKILSIQRLRRSWFFLIVLTFLVFQYIGPFGGNGFPYPIIIYIIIYFVLIFLTIVMWINSKSNRNFYKPMQLNFGQDKVEILSGQSSVFDTPTKNELAYDSIIKKQKISNYYLLYIAKNSFIIIPNHVFKTEEDLDDFKKLLSIS